LSKLPSRSKSKFTRKEIETAIRVLMEAKIVRNWVKSEAKFFGVDLDTPRGKIFFEQNARAMAERLIR